MSRLPSPPVDIAIVNWNTAEAALDAARAYLSSEGIEPRVTIVDNASAPEQRTMLEDELPDQVRLDLCDENLGYGRAANRVLREGSAELICVSNADAAPEPAALAELARVALEEPDAGMVGPLFGGTDGYHAERPGAVTMLARIFVGSFRASPPPLPGPGEVRQVPQPSGACFVMRRDAWELAGGFDEEFFLWYEDVDLAKRVEELGMRNLVAGSARVGHAGARAFVQLASRQKQGYRLDSVERYIRRHHPAVTPIARPLLWISRRLRADGTRR